METVYQLAVRLSLETIGIATAAGAAVRGFGSVESAASRAERAVSSLNDRINSLTYQQQRSSAAIGQGRTAQTAAANDVAALEQRYDAINEKIASMQRIADSGAMFSKSDAFQAGMNDALAERMSLLEKLMGAQGRLADATITQNNNLMRDAQLALTSAKAHDELAQAIGRQEAAMRRQQTVESGMNDLMVGGMLLGGGLMGAHMLGGMIGNAAQFQLAFQQVQMALARQKGTGETLAQFQHGLADFNANGQQLFFNLAGQTAFSATTIAQMARRAAMTGLNSPDVLMSMLPTMARAAEVEYATKGISPEQSVMAFTQMAHFFRQYPSTIAQANAPGGFEQMIELATKASFASGGSPMETLRMMQYLGPALSAYHLKPEEIFALTALAQNVGLSVGRGGGSRVGALFARLVSGGSRSAQANRERADIERIGGGSFFTASGQYAGLENTLKVVRNFIEKEHDQRIVMQYLNDVFQRAGASAVIDLADPRAVSRFQTGLFDITAGLGQGGFGNVSQMQNTLNTTAVMALKTLNTDLESMGTIIGLSVLPSLTVLLNLIKIIAGSTVGILAAHQGFAGLIGIMIVTATTIATVRGAMLLFNGAMKLLGFTEAAAMMKKGIILLAEAFAPMLLDLPVIIAEFGLLDTVLGLLASPVVIIMGVITGLVLIVTHFTDILHTAGAVFSWLGTQIHNVIQLIASLWTNPHVSHAADPTRHLPGTHPGFFVPNLTHHHQPPPGKHTLPPSNVHLHFHMNGMDHQTASAYAQAVKNAVLDELDRHLNNEIYYGSTSTLGFEPAMTGH